MLGVCALSRQSPTGHSVTAAGLCRGEALKEHTGLIVSQGDRQRAQDRGSMGDRTRDRTKQPAPKTTETW